MEFLNSNIEQTFEDEAYIAPDDVLMQQRNSSACMSLPINSSTLPFELTDDELRATVRSLNMKQRHAYEILLNGAEIK